MPLTPMPNQRWSLDYVAETFGASRKFQILAVIDDCCHEQLCLVADTSISGAQVARTGADLWKAGLHRQLQWTEFAGRTVLK